MNSQKQIYIITGAHDTGKTATLRHLKENYEYVIFKEAPKRVLESLGQRCYHDPILPFKFNYSQQHVCPKCRPIELTKLVVREQKNIENKINGCALLERGFPDYVAFLKSMNVNFSTLKRELKCLYKYHKIFLLDVIPEIQEAKFGKTKQERIKEAFYFNQLLLTEYKTLNYEVLVVPPVSVQDRAMYIHENIINP